VQKQLKSLHTLRFVARRPGAVAWDKVQARLKYRLPVRACRNSRRFRWKRGQFCPFTAILLQMRLIASGPPSNVLDWRGRDRPTRDTHWNIAYELFERVLFPLMANSIVIQDKWK